MQRGVEYYIAFAISSKRRNIKDWLFNKRDVLTNKATGKGGLEGLLWARNQLVEFEKFISSRQKETTICIAWTDNKRRDIYEHFLTRIGYKLGQSNGKKCLFKKIEREATT